MFIGESGMNIKTKKIMLTVSLALAIVLAGGFVIIIIPAVDHYAEALKGDGASSNGERIVTVFLTGVDEQTGNLKVTIKAPDGQRLDSIVVDPYYDYGQHSGNVRLEDLVLEGKDGRLPLNGQFNVCVTSQDYPDLKNCALTEHSISSKAKSEYVVIEAPSGKDKNSESNYQPGPYPDDFVESNAAAAVS